MGRSLVQYVHTRTHELIDGDGYDSIDVLGSYNRNLIVSTKEKCDKLENWQRPTAEFKDGVLRIHCFPGRAYVFHYASLIATHLALTGRDPTLVRMILPEPSECRSEILKSGFERLQPTPALVVASGNEKLNPDAAEWIDHGRFMARTEAGRVTWLAVKHSFWGDIAFHLGNALAEVGFKLVIFVGKLGSLDPEHVPNRTLATGSTSTLAGHDIRWSNTFVPQLDRAMVGRHVTVPSVLQETVTWRDELAGHFEFVDPEIGNFALGVTNAGAHFSYLHIISDNLSKTYRHDLSNERENIVVRNRADCYAKIRDMVVRAVSV